MKDWTEMVAPLASRVGGLGTALQAKNWVLALEYVDLIRVRCGVLEALIVQERDSPSEARQRSQGTRRYQE